DGTESHRCTPLSHSTNGPCGMTVAGLTQVSIVKPLLAPTLSAGEAGMRTPSSMPSNCNAGPTNPFPKTGLPNNTPVFVPFASAAVPSNFHQPTKPGGSTHSPLFRTCQFKLTVPALLSE